jgi:hypothetical protein
VSPRPVEVDPGFPSFDRSLRMKEAMTIQALLEIPRRNKNYLAVAKKSRLMEGGSLAMQNVAVQSNSTTGVT